MGPLLPAAWGNHFTLLGNLRLLSFNSSAPSIGTPLARFRSRARPSPISARAGAVSPIAAAAWT